MCEIVSMKKDDDDDDDDQTRNETQQEKPLAYMYKEEISNDSSSADLVSKTENNPDTENGKKNKHGKISAQMI